MLDELVKQVRIWRNEGHESSTSTARQSLGKISKRTEKLVGNSRIRYAFGRSRASAGVRSDRDGMTEERRKKARVPIELKVEYKRLNRFFADYAKNISKGGTFIRTEKPLPIGTSFVFLMFVPKLEEPLRFCGRVQWRIEDGGDDEPGMGIGFVFDSEAERQRIEATVERLMKDSLGIRISKKLLTMV